MRMPSPLVNRALLSQSQVKYVEDINVTIYTENLGISRREVIQTISDIGQENSYAQTDNPLYSLIW